MHVTLPHCFCTPQKNNFQEQKQHLMKEWSIPDEYMSLVLKNSVIALNGITVQYLLLSLISMETQIL